MATITEASTSVRQESRPRLILASGSFYRRELLNRLGLSFKVVSPDVNEKPAPGESPEKTALRLAEYKAATVGMHHPDALIIGSDQVATLDGEQIGKPGSHEAALNQLQKMRGREVIFHTAICLWDGRRGSTIPIQIENVQTAVYFRHLDDAALNNYLLIEKPYDCAGSAKNEGLGIALMDRIVSSDPTALTGLPLIALCSMLMKTGVHLF